MTDDPSISDRAKQNATGIVATTVTGTWLAALMLGADWWLAAMLFGYIVLVPVTAMLFDDEEDPEPSDETAAGVETARTRTGVDTRTDALELLRTRYAAGELTDEEFEHALDRLLETETIGDAERWMHRTRSGGGTGDLDGGASGVDARRESATGAETESARGTDPDR